MLRQTFYFFYIVFWSIYFFSGCGTRVQAARAGLAVEREKSCSQRFKLAMYERLIRAANQSLGLVKPVKSGRAFVHHNHVDATTLDIRETRPGLRMESFGGGDQTGCIPVMERWFKTVCDFFKFVGRSFLKFLYFEGKVLASVLKIFLPYRFFVDFYVRFILLDILNNPNADLREPLESRLKFGFWLICIEAIFANINFLIKYFLLGDHDRVYHHTSEYSEELLEVSSAILLFTQTIAYGYDGDPRDAVPKNIAWAVLIGAVIYPLLALRFGGISLFHVRSRLLDEYSNRPVLNFVLKSLKFLLFYLSPSFAMFVLAYNALPFYFEDMTLSLAQNLAYGFGAFTIVKTVLEYFIKHIPFAPYAGDLSLRCHSGGYNYFQLCRILAAITGALYTAAEGTVGIEDLLVVFDKTCAESEYGPVVNLFALSCWHVGALGAYATVCAFLDTFLCYHKALIGAARGAMSSSVTANYIMTLPDLQKAISLTLKNNSRKVDLEKRAIRLFVASRFPKLLKTSYLFKLELSDQQFGLYQQFCSKVFFDLYGAGVLRKRVLSEEVKKEYVDLSANKELALYYFDALEVLGNPASLVLAMVCHDEVYNLCQENYDFKVAFDEFLMRVKFSNDIKHDGLVSEQVTVREKDFTRLYVELGILRHKAARLEVSNHIGVVQEVVRRLYQRYLETDDSDFRLFLEISALKCNIQNNVASVQTVHSPLRPSLSAHVTSVIGGDLKSSKAAFPIEMKQTPSKMLMAVADMLYDTLANSVVKDTQFLVDVLNFKNQRVNRLMAVFFVLSVIKSNDRYSYNGRDVSHFQLQFNLLYALSHVEELSFQSVLKVFLSSIKSNDASFSPAIVNLFSPRNVARMLSFQKLKYSMFATFFGGPGQVFFEALVKLNNRELTKSECRRGFCMTKATSSALLQYLFGNFNCGADSILPSLKAQSNAGEFDDFAFDQAKKCFYYTSRGDNAISQLLSAILTYRYSCDVYLKRYDDDQGLNTTVRVVNSLEDVSAGVSTDEVGSSGAEFKAGSPAGDVDVLQVNSFEIDSDSGYSSASNILADFHTTGDGQVDTVFGRDQPSFFSDVSGSSRELGSLGGSHSDGDDGTHSPVDNNGYMQVRGGAA